MAVVHYSDCIYSFGISLFIYMLNTLFDTTHTARIPTTRFLFIPPMRREKKQASVVIVFLYTFFSKLARANSSKRCRRRCVYLLFLLLFSSSSTKQQLKSLRAARHKTRGTIRQNIQRAIPDCKIHGRINIESAFRAPPVTLVPSITFASFFSHSPSTYFTLTEFTQ